MDFDNEIKTITDEIYRKVINFIEENCQEDRILYDYSYLKLGNDKQIIYSYGRNTLYVTNPDEKDFFGTLGSDASIGIKEISYRVNKTKYESIEGSDQLSEYAKKRIIKYFKNLNLLLDSLEYNKEKTKDVDNFNTDLFMDFSEHMHNKELDKLKESGETVLESCKIAANWWANKIFNDYDNKKIITNEQLENLKIILAKKIMDKVYEIDNEVIQMRCDYGPDYILCNAAIEAGINNARPPFKTDVYVRAYWVGVKDGYGAPTITIYDTTTKEDIDLVIEKFLNENSKTLKKQL